MIAIKDMEMLPRSCMNCDMFQMVEGDYGKCRCYLTQTYVNYSDEYLKKRADDCPLVEIEERKVGKCPDCNEYNQEKHYCPKFCDVIRDTTEEMQEFYKGEHEKLERIEQLVNNYDGSMFSMIKQFNEIQKVLEQE